MSGHVTRRRIAFHGLRAAGGPSTAGQRDFWRRVNQPGEPAFGDMSNGGLVPAGLSVEQVLDGIAALAERHESLRTLFRVSGGELEQHVLGSGEIEVELFDIDGLDFRDAVGEWRPQAPDVQHDPGSEMPFAARIGLSGGAPVLFQLWMSHLSADYLSSCVLAGELVELLEGRLDRPAGAHPVAQAEWERSPAGRRALARAADHWKRELDAAPSAMFPAPVAAPESPRYWRGGLRSQRVLRAANELAVRHRVGTTHVLLAAVTALLARRTGRDRCPVRLLAGNRSRPVLRHAVGNLSQEVLCVVDLSSATSAGGTFGDAVRAAWNASLRAQRHGLFDPHEVAGLIDGADADLGIGFNDLWAPVRGHLAASGEPPGPTSFAWERRIESASATFFLEVFEVLEDPSAVRLSLLADTAHLPPPALKSFLFAVEDLLVAAADSDEDLPLPRVPLPGDGARTGERVHA
ncbi:condensation domain-containing protein [Actinomadura sp. 1N219]|uniref:condensation domain-containing protein n=1 Tax=Actinomadura sp. 1N219 TaxID=3375152 RepID=UPI00379428AD